MPNRRSAASSTRRPSGTTSLPMPSPGITAILCLAMLASALLPARVHSGSSDSTPAESELDLAPRRRALPLAIVVLAEEQRPVGVHREPRAATDLVLELAGRPTRVAEREERARRPAAVADGLEDRGIPAERNAIADRPRVRPGVV